MDENTEQQIIARLDYIERYLVNLGQVSGYRYAPFVTTVGAQVVQGARGARRLQLLRQRGQMMVGREHFRRGQVPPGQGRGPGVLVPPFHPGLGQRFVLPPLCGVRVGGQHRPAGRGA